MDRHRLHARRLCLEQAATTQPRGLRSGQVERGEPLLVLSPVAGFDGSKVDELPKDSESAAEVKVATDYGGQMALKVTAAIPATMAVGYCCC